MTRVPKDFNKETAARIKNQLSALGMSQRELARLLKVSEPTVSAWIHAQKTPRMENIDEMCKIFNCKRTDLIDMSTIEPDESDRQLLFLISALKRDDALRQRVVAYVKAFMDIQTLENEVTKGDKNEH